MQNFYNSFTFILSFMLLIMIFNAVLGDAFTDKFLLLVLLSMLVVNSGKVSSLFNGLKGGNS